MISDVLHQTIDDIEYYLNDQAFKDVYTGNLKEQIINLKTNMQIVQKELDTCQANLKPPDSSPGKPPKRGALE